MSQAAASAQRGRDDVGERKRARGVGSGVGSRGSRPDSALCADSSLQIARAGSSGKRQPRRGTCARKAGAESGERSPRELRDRSRAPRPVHAREERGGPRLGTEPRSRRPHESRCAPPRPRATTGVPQASASSGTMPKSSSPGSGRRPRSAVQLAQLLVVGSAGEADRLTGARPEAGTPPGRTRRSSGATRARLAAWMASSMRLYGASAETTRKPCRDGRAAGRVELRVDRRVDDRGRLASVEPRDPLLTLAELARNRPRAARWRGPTRRGRPREARRGACARGRPRK